MRSNVIVVRDGSIEVVTQAKELGLEDIRTSATDLVDTANTAILTGAEVGVINKKNLARRVNRKRMGMRPQDPKDMDFVLDQEALPDGFWRDDIEVEGRRHLIFSTDAQVNVLGRAARWYVDGTFKCMRFPFVMLLTIHAFVRRADCTKQVPLVYAVMSGRKTRDYVAVFESVRRFVNADEVRGMVIDYEKALWKATRHVFPNINLSGCAFHWGQAVFGHVKSLGLTTQYVKNNATHSYLRQLLCLPFLPKEHIRPTFEVMCNFNTSAAIAPLLTYMNRHWFSSSVWSVDEWCVYGQSIRTNNDVEGWHRRLNAKTGTGPAFYNLVGILYKEAKEVEYQVNMVSELCLRRVQRLQYRTMQRELFDTWDMYAQGDLSATGLLKKVSVIYAPRVSVHTTEDDSD